MDRRNWILGLFVVMLTAAFGVALTETPPAEEGICDPLQDATPGLYGLCVAFCEAHACVPDLNAENPLAHCRPGSSKVLAAYERKMQPGDPEMPCYPQEQPCPCFTADQVDLLQPQVDYFHSCDSEGSYKELIVGYDPALGAAADESEEAPFCSWGTGTSFTYVGLQGELDKAVACAAIVEEAVNAAQQAGECP
jgi:hypothetical protein